jgi:hypothetical protein
MVTNVYAPTDHDQKLPFLQEIQTIQPPSNTPWILLGDFNLMWNSTDKNNPSFRQDEADAFNDAIHNLALIELPLTDRLYTWSSNRSEPTLQRIDMAFINICWNQIFPNSTLSSLTRFTSDHVPLLITVSTHIPRPALFRFESSWAQIPQCGPIIANAWASAQHHSNAASRLARKLKRTRQALKTWRRSFSSQKIRESNTKCAIAFIDHLEETRNLSLLEFNLRKLLVKILQRLIKERVAFWRQRSKIKFAIDGDENTKYFHALASTKYRKNKIHTLQHDGSDYSSHHHKMNILTAYFKQLLGQPFIPNWSFSL